MKKFLLVFVFIFLYLSVFTYAQRGKHGSVTINTSGVIVNAYTRLTANASQGATSITVASNELSTNFSTNLGVGDLVFIIQMQGATITYGDTWEGYGYINYYNDAGKYELAQVASVSGSNIINLSCGLTQNYTASGYVQVVRVPRYNSLTINSGASLTCPAWDGLTGGVLVVESLNSINNNGSVNVNGKGFRGGIASTSISNSYTEKWYAHADPTKGGQKGEGIAGRGEVAKQYCKGAPANGGGGGNSHNCGGGGGCNVSANLSWTFGRGIPDNSCLSCTAAWELEATGMSTSISYGGGRGGYSFSANDLDAATVGPGNSSWGGTNRENDGGNGGWPLNENQGLFPRLFLGGGGGGGHANDNEGGAGGNGGGLIYFMSYGGISGSGTFYANGMPGGNSEGGTPPFNESTGTDGSGGGGGGGTIVLNALSSIINVSAWADGGKGGDQIKKCYPNPLYTNDEAEGPGGGGGGGYIAVSGSPSIPRSTAGGVNGTTTATPASHNSLDEFPPNGATKGGPGISNGVVTNFNIATPTSVTACQGQPITLTATLQGSVPSGVTYGWYDQIVGGTLLSSQQTLTISNPQVQDTFYFGTCPGTYRVRVIMYVSAFMPSAGSDVSYCVGSSAGLQASCGGCASASYAWSPSTGLSNIYIANPTCSATTTTTYTVTITNQDGCSAADNVTATVFPNNTISLSSAAGTNAQTKCINTALTTITYSTTGATGATITGLPAGVTGLWASNVVTISGTLTVSGTYTYTITLTGGCGTITATGTITVTPNNTVTAASSTPALCINTALTAITHTTTGATGIGTATGLPAGVTASWASNTITISGTPTVSGTFNYSIPLTGGCGTVTATGNITVMPNNTVTAASSTPTLCINTALTAITHTTTGATGIGTATGLPAGVTASWASNTITISGTPTVSGTFNYSIPLTGGCGTVTATGTITVTPDNTISLTAGGTQTKCINTAITTTTYATTGASGASVTGLPAGVTGSWASNVVTISGTPTVSGVFTYTVTLNGGCGTVSATGTITVTPDNTIALTSAAGTNAQTKCINTAITNITYGTTGATGATVTGLPAGVTGAWASNVVTISGTPTVSGSFTYTITLNGGCGSISATGTITVTPNNTITLTSAAGTNAQTKCINTAITNITYSTTGATGTTVTGLPAGISGSWASNAVTISGTPTVSGAFTYTVTLNGGCGTISTTGTITVTPDNTVTLTSPAGTNAQTKCINTAITNITYGTTGATGASVTGLPAGISGSWASNMVTISGTPTVSGSSTYTVTLNGGCGTVSATGTITVTPDNTIALVAGGNQSVCVNAPITTVVYATTGATGAAFAGLPSGVTGNWSSNVVTISGNPTVTGTYTYTVTLLGGCGNVSSGHTITVTNINTITLTSASGTDSQQSCVNTQLTDITYSTAGATGATFSGLPAGVTGNWASGTVTISGTPTVAGTYTYTVGLTGGCGVVSATGTITVTPSNTIILTSPAGSNAQTVCVSNPILNIIYTTTGATGVTFSGLPAGVSGSWSSNTVTISGTPTITGAYTYSITLTGGCGTMSASGTINVVTNNTIALSSAPGTDVQTLCINTALTAVTYNTGGATGAVISGLPAGVTGNWGSNAVTISGTPTVTGTFVYTIALTGGCGTISATGSITVNPMDNAAFDYPLSTYCQSGVDPAANITGGFTGSFTASPGGLTFLNTSTGLIDLSASALNNYVITFTTNGSCPVSSTYSLAIISAPSADFSYTGPYCQNDANPLPTMTTGAMTGVFSAAPTGLVFVNTGTGQVNLGASNAGTYTVTNSISATAGCPAVSATASITINAVPTVVVPLDISVCNNEVVPAISFLGVPFSTVVSWSNSNTSIGLGASGTGTIASFSAINTGTAPVTATITLTPSANNCIGADTSFTITVNPTPAAMVPSDITVCNGAAVPAMSFTSQTPGTSFTWTNSNTAIGLAASGTGNITSFTAVNTTNAPVSATISVTPSANGCTGSVSDYIITVNPSPLAIVPSDTSICHGATVPGAVFTSTISGATFTWTNSSPSIGIPASGSGNVPSFTAANSGTTPVIASISVVASANSCAGQPETYTITVNPLPVIVMNNTLPECPGLNNGTITPEITVGTPPYQFLWSTGAATDQLTDLGNGTYMVTVTDSHGCQSSNSLDFDVLDDCLDPVVYVPNIFSPNGDNNNDVIFVHGQGIKTMQWMIFDRWGEKIFASEEIAVGWDGTYKGKDMPAGVYVFRLKVTFNDGNEIEKKGNITLVR